MTLTALAKHIFDSGFGGQNPVDDKTNWDVQDNDEGFAVKGESQEQTRLEAHVSRWHTDESISELDDLKTVRDDPEEHHRFFGSAADAISNAQTNITQTFQSIEIPEHAS
jgi:hypothetical protein